MQQALHQILEKPFPRENAPKIAIVIVNYNSESDIERCIASLSKVNNQKFITIIVDAASPDGSGRRLKSKFANKKTEFILLHENNGFASASNYGIAAGLSLKVDFIWLLNPDTEVRENSLDAFLSAADSFKDSAAFGSKIYYGKNCVPKQLQTNKLSNEVILWSVGGKVDVNTRQVTMLGSHESDIGQYDSSCLCDYLPGCSIFIRAEAFRKIGLLPEKYFMYFEETDWCRALAKTGAGLRYVPDSVVVHHTKDSKMHSAFVIYYYNRNELVFWSKQLQLKSKIKLYIDVIIRRIPRNIYALLFAKNKNDKLIFKAHIASSIDFLLGRLGKKS